jgi:hypothetical protein
LQAGLASTQNAALATALREISAAYANLASAAAHRDAKSFRTAQTRLSRASAGVAAALAALAKLGYQVS